MTSVLEKVEAMDDEALPPITRGHSHRMGGTAIVKDTHYRSSQRIAKIDRADLLLQALESPSSSAPSSPATKAEMQAAIEVKRQGQLLEQLRAHRRFKSV
jgi:hypothetical protein